MKVILSKKEQICDGTLYTEYTPVEGKIGFIPGQFFKLTWSDPAYTDSRGNSRFLGFVNIPNEQGVAATVTRMGPSAFKRTLLEAQTGRGAEIDGIDGKMTLPEGIEKEIVMITGGIGVAPLMSLLRWVKDKQTGHKIKLIYSNTNRTRALWMDELNQLAEASENFDFVPTMTQDPEWGGETRRIDAEFLREKAGVGEGKIYFVTGTPRFAPFMVKHLREIGVDQTQVKFEIFTGY